MLQFYAFLLLLLTSFIQLPSQPHLVQKLIRVSLVKLLKPLNHLVEEVTQVQTPEVKGVKLKKTATDQLELLQPSEKIQSQATWVQELVMMVMRNQARMTMMEIEETDLLTRIRVTDLQLNKTLKNQPKMKIVTHKMQVKLAYGQITEDQVTYH